MKNNSKRIFALLLAIVMCVSCVVPVFAEVNVHDHAEETPVAKCPGVGEEHTFTNCDSTFVETVAPQCGQFGYDLYECNTCKAPVVTNWTNADNEGHVYGEPEVVKAPTCYEVGKQVVTCANCGHKIETELPKIAHTITNNKVVGALCKEGIPAWTEWCTAEGCDYEVEHAAEAGHDCDSRYVAEIVKAPNCKEDGIAIVKCRDCSYESTEVVVKATVGHNWVKDGEFTIAPTCGTAGSGNAKCTVCYATAEVVEGVVTETINIPGFVIENHINVPGFEATGVHAFTVDVEAKAATCTEAGWQAHKKCANCDATSLDGTNEVNVTLAKLGHTWVDVPAVIATCTKNGNVAHSKCSVCDALSINKTDIVTEAEIIDKAHHSYDLDGDPVAQSVPTCTKFGFKFYGCTVCGMPAAATGNENIDLPADQEGWVAPGVYRLPMKAHDLELVSEVAGDCETDGVALYDCKDCDYTEEKVTKTLGHQYETEEVKANCQQDGYKLDKCTVCGEVRVGDDTDADGKYDKVAKDPDNHKWDKSQQQITTQPSCTQKGQAIDYCPYCSVHEANELPMLPHNANKLQDTKVVAPTCTEEGYTYYIYVCDGCGGNETKVYAYELDELDALYVAKVPANGHTLGATVNTPATCTTIGFDTRTCTVAGCTYKETYTLDDENKPLYPATGHVNTTVTVIDPTCNKADAANLKGTDGKKTETCDACGATIKETVIPFNWNNSAHHPGSTFIKVYREGNCVVTKLLQYTCPTCEREFYEEDDSMIGQHEIDTTITNLYGAYVAPTCTTAGEYEHGACAKCENTVYVNAKGEYVIYDDAADYVIEALGHAWEDMAGKDATCTATGVKAYSYCARLACMLHTLDRNAETIVPFDAADLKNVTLIPAKGHNFDTELVAEVPATCTEDGVKAHYECADCDAVSLDGVDACDADKLVIAAINHENGWINGESEIANCLEAGYDYKYCKFCGIEEVYNYVYPLGHKFVDVAEVSATCIATGVAAHKNCTACGENFAADETDLFSTNYKTESDLELAKLPHKNANGDVITDECTSTITDRECAACGQTIEAVHNKVNNVVEATCQEYGYNAWYCTICKANGVEQNANFKPTNPGHENKELLVWVTTVEPGLYTPGEKKLVCDKCDYVEKTEVIPAKGGIEFSYEIDNAIVPGAAFVNGGQIKLTIKYKAVDADLANITLRLTYNANVLSFVSGDFQCDAVDAEGNKIFNVENADIGGATPGVIVVSANTFGFGQQPVDKTLNGEGVLAVVYLNIKQDTVAGSTFDFNVDTDAALSPSQVLKADSTPANVHSFGTISNEAKTRALADIDIDANFTSADELEFLGIAFSEDYNAAADINQDGLIGSDDYKLLRDYLLGTITYAEMCAAAQK